MSVSVSPNSNQASRPVALFEACNDESAQILACHAAFPIALSSDLLYCLRESFEDLRDCAWYQIGDILLSPLCETIGHDLYAMDAATRDCLLTKLQQYYGEPQFTQRLEALQDFLLAYVRHRLGLDAQRSPHHPSQRAKTFGTLPHLTVLAYTRPTLAVEQLRQEIEQHLRHNALNSPPHLIPEIQAISQILAERGYSIPLVENWADRFAAGQPLPHRQAEHAAEMAKRIGVTLAPFDFEILEVDLSPSTRPEPESSLDPFEFMVITVDRRGREQKREQERATQFTEWLGNGENRLGLEMVAIRNGQFTMGSPSTEAGRYNNEGPQHLVTIHKPFFIGKYPITQAQWRFIANLDFSGRDDLNIDPDPSSNKGDNHPVESITWQSAQRFCARLSAYTGRTYTLPSEAEWEYACRAGTTTPFHFGETITPDLANYDWGVTYAGFKGKKQKSFRKTTPVGHFAYANAFGLYDMHGNVWEWCEDHWHGSYDNRPTDGSAWLDQDDNDNRFHVLRGGSWGSNPVYCRSACRIDLLFGGDLCGFRVVCRARGLCISLYFYPFVLFSTPFYSLARSAKI